MRDLPSKVWQKVSEQIKGKVYKPRLGDLVDRVRQAYKRRYYRHVFAGSELAFARIDGQPYEVLDISYGGLRIGFRDGRQIRSFQGQNKDVNVELGLLSEVSNCPMRITSIGPDSAGLSFDPRSTFHMLFLDRYLFFMDSGVMIKALPKHDVRKSYQSPDWLSYGDPRGNIEIHLHMDMTQAHIYYVNGSRHDFVWFRPDRISVSCSPRVELSVKEKKEILSHVICLLLGMRQIGRTDRLNHYINRGFEKLKKPSRAAS